MLHLAIRVIRAFFILSSLAMLMVRLTPALADRFLAYGARDQTSRHGKDAIPSARHPPRSVGIQILDYMATFDVPHSWFTHFYVVSVACSILCLCIFHYGGYIPSQDQYLPLLTSVLMLIQGSRRLLECLFLTKPSASRMWIGHYLIGLLFYLFTNISIWIEHINPSDVTKPRTIQTSNPLTIILIPIYCLLFIYASYTQYTYHRYLFSLRKYTLPNLHGTQTIIAPHYNAECMIYLSVALLDSPPLYRHHPQPHLIPIIPNWTLICALIFVTVNLGITADATKQWLLHKFPEKRQEILHRFRMIPIFRYVNLKDRDQDVVFF